MINTGKPINYKPSYSEDGNLLPDNVDVTVLGGCSYLIDKATEAIYDLGAGLNGENAVTDNKEISMSWLTWKTIWTEEDFIKFIHKIFLI